MKENTAGHVTATTWITTAPAELEAGAAIAAKIQVACPHNCSLDGGLVRISDHAGILVEQIELLAIQGGPCETPEVVLQAPRNPGEYTFVATYAAQNVHGVPHALSMAPFSFVVKPHATSIAVWDVSSPIIGPTPFKVTVGVQCAVGCRLAGQPIQVIDQAGNRVAHGLLGDTLWSTTGLYWTELEMVAPETEGTWAWSVQFIPDLELQHEQTSYRFSFVTVRKPEHVATITVIDRVDRTAVSGALVMLHPFQGTTDEHGVAYIPVNNGEYELVIPKDGRYQTYSRTITVDGDTPAQAELVRAPVYEP